MCPPLFTLAVLIAVFALSLATIRTEADGPAPNLLPNGDFQRGETGQLPAEWELHAYRPSLAPKFSLEELDGRKVLKLSGGGVPDCVGYLAAKAPIKLGQTYLFRVVFRVAPNTNPDENLLLQCYGPGANDGIHEYRRQADGWVVGETKITYTGANAGTTEDVAEAECRLLYRFNPHGAVWVREVSLSESTPDPPRWVRVACTSGKTNLASCEAVLDAVGKAGVDLVLLPEYMQGDRIEEPADGPSFQLMSAKARQYRMYVAGGIVRYVPETDRTYNTGLLIDRQGQLVGMYDKIHPYSPEVNDQGITPGNRVPVFRTDFGLVGMMICYDSWFTDVAELLALKGAEIILFPNAGYYRALMHARAADNRVRIVCSSWNSGNGVWDTVGRDLGNPEVDTSHGNPPGVTHKDVHREQVGEVEVLYVTLDLNCSPSPHWNGGTMFEAPGGRRNRRDQTCFLEDMIRQERERWWKE